MKCYRCGTEFEEGMAFCQRCGASLRGPAPGTDYGTTQLQATGAKRDFWPIFVPFLGIIIAAVGVLLYFLGFRDTINDISDPNYDPWANGPDDSGIDILLASFVVMGFGGIIFFAGLIWLVVRSG